jgi:5-methylcytosine-specific restriction endonuclease McrA
MTELFLKCRNCGGEFECKMFNRYSATKRGYSLDCKACTNEKMADYRRENKGRPVGQLRDTSEQSRFEVQKLNSRANGYRKYNPEQRRNSQRNNRLRCVAYAHSREARKKAIGGSFTAKQFKELCEQHGNRCLCCGQEKPLTADHVIPISHSNSSNSIENIQPLCQSCNSRKKDKFIDYRPIKKAA